MSGMAVVFGLCALSFAAGCVLTAVMLRREQPPEPTSEPAAAEPEFLFEPQFPPEEYATKPIHRNPVMGIPTALPASARLRPNLVVVPDPAPETGNPEGQDEVRRMHVVRTAPEVEPAVEALGPVEPVEPVAEPAEPDAGATREAVVRVAAQPGPDPTRRAFEAARRESNR
jgi:hypothetical protein